MLFLSKYNKQYKTSLNFINILQSTNELNEIIDKVTETCLEYIFHSMNTSQGHEESKTEQIIIEDKSTSTIENMKFSKDKIDEINDNGNIVFSTTNYHVFRSGVIANNQGIDCEGIGSKTKWYFYTNALIREFIASLVQERRSHIILILLINISLLILIAIGRYYNFLNIIN